MNKEFVTMVLAMREAQREDDDGHSQALHVERVRCETKVDFWLERYLAKQVQLDLWTRAVNSSEEPGSYNAADETAEE